jgi:hypothetical protein
MLNALEAVQAVIAYQKALGVTEQDEQWVYVTDAGSNTCEHCLEREGQVYTRNNELDLMDIFPDLTYDSDTTISPNVHMTLWGKMTCKCKLFLSNLSVLTNNQPDKPIMDDPETKLEDLKPVEQVKPSVENNPFQIDFDQKQLSDTQYIDFLDGLLSLGYISLATYQAIIARRKKQNQNQNNSDSLARVSGE